MKIASEKPLDFRWGDVVRVRGVDGDWLCFIFAVPNLIDKPWERSRAKASIAKEARISGFQLGRKFALQAASHELLASVKRTLKQTVCNIRSSFPHWAAYVLANTLVTEAAPENWKGNLVHVQANVNEFDFDSVSYSESERRAYENGDDLIRVPYDSKMHLVPEDEKLIEKQNLAITDWSRNIGAPAYVAQNFFTPHFERPDQYVHSISAATALHAFQCCQDANESTEWLTTVENKNLSLLWSPS